MSVRQITIRSLALVAAVAVTGAPLMAQQDTTRLRRTASQTRINVSKGEVELRVRVDTVHLTRYDTVRVENTIVRVDTVMVAAPAPAIVFRPEGSWYWSLFAGATAPVGDIDLLYTNGYHAGGAFGWDPRASWLGARLSASLAQLGREQDRSTTLVGSGTALMWQVAGDLKLKANFGGWSLYTLGGLGFNSYNRMATVDDGEDLVVNPLEPEDIRSCESDFEDPQEINCFRLPNDDWSTQFSWSFGAGTDFHIGRQDMFLEVRWNPISTNGTYTWYVPISLGVRFF